MAKYNVIIDADGIVYRVGFALEDADSPRLVERTVDTTIKNYIDSLTRVFGVQGLPTLVVSGLGEHNNFRFDVATTLPYKGNRKQPKPKYYNYIREYLISKANTIVTEGIEADDLIADMAEENPEKTVIVSIDKDLRQVPGWHFEPDGEFELVLDKERDELVSYLSPKRPIYYVGRSSPGILQLEKSPGNKTGIFGTGDRWIYAQMMLGDTIDNIPGLKGYGPVKVYNLLNGKEDYKEITKRAYEKEGVLDRFDEIYRLVKLGSPSNE